MVVGKKRVLLLLHEGVEEIEAVVPWDLLRRAQLEVATASLGQNLTVRGAHNILLTADGLFSPTMDLESFDCLLLPGGSGVFNLLDRTDLFTFLRRWKASEKWIAAICAAPLLLKQADLLPERYTAHPSVANELPKMERAALVVSQQTITANGPGSAFELAFAIVSALHSPQEVSRLQQGLGYNK